MPLTVCRDVSNNNNNNNNGNNNNGILSDEIADLNNNVGRIVTVFTNSGGCSGNGFTGLLVDANRHFIKLVTSLPTAPRNPFGLSPANFFNDRSCGRRLGTACIIPINQIVCFSFNEV